MERSRPDGASKLDRVLTHWTTRLVVVTSMLLALTASIVGTAVPAAAAAPGLWTQLSPASPPSARSGASIAYDPGTGQTILFGGNANGTAEGDTWSWTGTTWTALSPATSPAARYDAAMAYDPATSQLLLFGGYDGTNYYADTWAWTGTTWTELTPTASPTVRAGASLAYDTSSSQMILFGGYNGSSYLQDTWTWSGTTWTQLTPSTTPPVRDEGSFAYDSSTSQMILFGGYAGSDLSDTWSWTGTNWSQINPTTSPPARFGAPIAYSPAIGELALFGGQGTGYDADTWVWTGANWNLLSSSSNPSVRTLAAMTYDSATCQMVLFGGYNGTSYLADTWQWSAVAVTAVSPIAGPTSGGGSVAITGIGFNGVTAVQFGTTNATSYAVNSSTQITAVSPAESVGMVNVTVTNASGASATSSADQFTYEAVPTVTALSPTSGPLAGGTSVAITGTNFTGATAVDFGVLAAGSYTVNSATSITATSPVEASGTSVDVTVTTPSGTSATSGADQFTYEGGVGIFGRVPDAPTNVWATAGNVSAEVTWQETADNGSVIVGYRVTALDLTTSANGGETCLATGEGTTSCNVAGLTSGDTYTFTVTATNGVGTSPVSGASNAVTPMTLPGAPTGVSAVSGNASATVSWTAPSSDGGSAIIRYVVIASGSGGQACTMVGATSCTVTGLQDGTAYTFTVTAANIFGTGPASRTSNQVTPIAGSSIAFKLSETQLTYGNEQVEHVSVTVSSQGASSMPSGTVRIGESRVTLCTITLSSGAGSCDLGATQLSAGRYRIVAAYRGGKSIARSVAPASLTVVKAATSTAFKLSATTLAYGDEQAENMTVTVSPQYPGPAPTGTVTIRGSSVLLCTITLTAGSGSCSLPATQLALGTHTIFATYHGNRSLARSIIGASLTVVRPPSRTTLWLSKTTISYGDEQVENLSVTVSSQYAGSTPTGTVNLSQSGITLCTVTLITGTGSCTLGATQLGVGNFHIVAAYRGDDMFASSVTGARLLVTAVSSTVLNLSATELIFGDEQVEHVSVTVSSRDPGSKPTGTVTIGESGVRLCTIALSAGTGSCRLSARQLRVGAYDIVSSYGGTEFFGPSLTSDALTVIA